MLPGALRPHRAGVLVRRSRGLSSWSHAATPTCGEADLGYSNDWHSSDEDENQDDEDMLIGGNISRRDAPTYDALVALDSHSNKHADAGAATAKSNTMPKLQQKLQRLSSIRVYALEAVPGQAGQLGLNGCRSWAAGPHRHAVPC